MNVSLNPFSCSGCGAVLPLGEGKVARCPYCNGETPIPSEYGAAQRAAKGFAADRKLAEELYGRVGKPPGRIGRALARGTEGAETAGFVTGWILVSLALGQPLIGIPLIMALAWLLGYPVAAAWRGIAWAIGAPVGKVLSPYPVLALTTLVVGVAVGIPIIVFAKERALAGVRADIHASLAAALPERPGGPSRCRTCGAALDVPRGALGVPCAYCKTDNLVALPEKWVASIRQREFHHFLQIDGALEAYRRASEAATERMWKLAFGVLFVLPVALGLAWLLDQAKIGF